MKMSRAANESCNQQTIIVNRFNEGRTVLRESNLVNIAAKTWNKADETLQQAEDRIHDGIPDLVGRANARVKQMFDLFPYAFPQQEPIHAMEIGGGVGYIMEAVGRRLDKQNVRDWLLVDLDIAEHMIAKAMTRLGHDPRYQFLHYNGLTVPAPDGAYDFIYSVAALQHIPKEYVYNLFFETKRLLKPTGYAIFELLSFRHLRHLHAHNETWKTYVDLTINHGDDHWLFFYSPEELEEVLRVGTEIPHVEVVTAGTFIYVCLGKTFPQLVEPATQDVPAS
jgi:SAM-dependent methyltransferase